MTENKIKPSRPVDGYEIGEPTVTFIPRRMADGDRAELVTTFEAECAKHGLSVADAFRAYREAQAVASRTTLSLADVVGPMVRLPPLTVLQALRAYDEAEDRARYMRFAMRLIADALDLPRDEPWDPVTAPSLD